MTSEEALFAKVRESPGDDAPRLIYADYLEERGNAERADFIRVQCELARLPEDAPARPALEDREHELLARHEAEWLGEFPEWAPEYCFERGFLTQFRSDTGTLLECGRSLFARHPITRLGIERPEPYELGPMDEMAEEPWLERVEVLDAEVFPPVLTSEHLRRLDSLRLTSTVGPDGEVPDFLARCPSLNRLRTFGCPGVLLDVSIPALVTALEQSQLTDLDLGYCEVGPGELTTLLRAGFGRRLTSLRISGNPLGAGAGQAFHELPPGDSLRRLDISGTNLAANGLASLLRAPALAGLTALSLDARDDREVEYRDLVALGGSAFWDRAEELRLHDIDCSDSRVEPLCRATGTKGLRVLDLGGTGLRTEGVRRLCRAPLADNVTWLDLSRNFLDDDALAALADSGRFSRLRHLDLRTNGPKLKGNSGERITSAGVERLARAPNLARLRHLNLTATAVTTRGVEALLNGPHWSLSGLVVRQCDLSKGVVSVLAKSPRLARLTELAIGFNSRLGGRTLLPLAESPYLSPLCKLDAFPGAPLDEAVRDAFRARLGWRFRG